MAEESPSTLSSDQLSQELSNLADGLSDFQDDLDQKLQEAVKQGGDAVERFYKKEFHLNNNLVEKVWGSQMEFLRKINVVNSNKELEEYFKSRYGDAKVRSAYEDWLEVEESWENFLKNSVDKALNKHYSEGIPTSVDPATVHLFDCNSDKEVTLKDSLKTPYTIFILLRFYG